MPFGSPLRRALFMLADKSQLENIQAISDSSELLKLKPVEFNVRGGTKKQFGFVAQQVAGTGLSNIVFANDRGVLSIGENQIIALLVHQNQSLHRRIAHLESLVGNP